MDVKVGSGALMPTFARSEVLVQTIVGVANGAAAERFGRMVEVLGGPADFIQRHDHYLPVATLSKPVFPVSAGYICAMDIRALGMTVVALDGGRQRASDAIDYSVGLTDMAWLGGDYVG